MNSMTGFGKGGFTVLGTPYRVEIRSLNSRFLDLRTKLPWNDAEVEGRVGELVRARISRGRVEVSAFELSASPPRAFGLRGARVELNEPLALALAAATQRMAELLGADVGAAAQLMPRLEALVQASAPEPTSGEAWEPFRAGLEEALDGMAAMRAREGAKLRADLLLLLEQLRRLTDRVAPIAAREPQRLAERLQGRLAQLQAGELDTARLAQEVAVMADRLDVSEELTRLASHRDQLGAMCEKPEPVGRAIEFMLQEVNRELNTIGSKTNHTEITLAMVEAKGLVEKMREQAQNVE